MTREALVEEKERLHMLLEVNNTLVTNRDLQKLFPAISGFIRRMIRYDYASVAVYDEAAHSLSLLSPGLSLDHRTGWHGHDLPVKDTPAGHALMERETKIFTREDLLGIQSSLRQPDAGTRNRVALLHSSDHPQGRTGHVESRQ